MALCVVKLSRIYCEHEQIYQNYYYCTRLCLANRQQQSIASSILIFNYILSYFKQNLLVIQTNCTSLERQSLLKLVRINTLFLIIMSALSGRLAIWYDIFQRKETSHFLGVIICVKKFAKIGSPPILWSCSGASHTTAAIFLFMKHQGWRWGIMLIGFRRGIVYIICGGGNSLLLISPPAAMMICNLPFY